MNAFLFSLTTASTDSPRFGDQQFLSKARDPCTGSVLAAVAGQGRRTTITELYSNIIGAGYKQSPLSDLLKQRKSTSKPFWRKSESCQIISIISIDLAQTNQLL